ncbi:MAG: hypothetical protein LH603_06115 [Pseudonocardia sp.]|nr:hypothetical protein [Pseudonocardia sp.]
MGVRLVPTAAGRVRLRDNRGPGDSIGRRRVEYRSPFYRTFEDVVGDAALMGVVGDVVVVDLRLAGHCAA